MTTISTIRKSAIAAGLVTAALGATAASSSAAYVTHVGTAAGPAGNGTQPFSGSTAAGAGAQLFNSAGTQIANCTSATLSGTILAAGLNITGPSGAGTSFSGCVFAGNPLTVTSFDSTDPNLATSWGTTALSGAGTSASPYRAGVTGVKVKLTACGTTRYLTGSIPSSAVTINNDATGSTISVNRGGPLTSSGLLCGQTGPFTFSATYKASTTAPNNNVIVTGP